MGLALQKSTDGGTTFQQVSVDVADYTSGGRLYDRFLSIKDSNNNTYLYCMMVYDGIYYGARIIKISSAGIKTIINITTERSGSGYNESTNPRMLQLSRDESTLFVATSVGYQAWNILVIPTNSTGTITPQSWLSANASVPIKFAIYKDQYIWVAIGTTVKIYDYDTKVELASNTVPTYPYLAICCGDDNVFYGVTAWGLFTLSFNTNPPTLTRSEYTLPNVSSRKQLVIDRFGDLNILTNTGTASTLLKYSNTGTLIDTVNLSVAGILGVGRGAYGLQVYSKDNGTKCWVQFSNDLGTWRTEAKSYDATPANRTFVAVSKIRDNGVTTYGDDHGGDNNYSVRC